MLILGRKRCFEQSDALCWKLLKRGQHGAKMLKRADLGLKTLFWTNSCPLLKTIRSGVPRVKMTKHADLGLKTLFRTNSCTLLKIANKWCAQCENDKTCWSRENNAVLLFGQTRAICWKELKSGGPSGKMTVPADLGLKTLFCTNLYTLLKKAKRCCTLCKYNKTCWSWAKSAVLYKLVNLLKIA